MNQSELHQCQVSIPAKKVAPRWTVRAYLVWLVLACLLPGIIAATVLLIHEYRVGLSELDKSSTQTTRALIQAVDNQVLRAQAVAQVLATDSFLASGDLATFHKRAREALAQSKLGLSIVLIDRNDQLVLDTSKEFGASLAKLGDLAAVRYVLDTGNPAVSDLFIGPLRPWPMIAVVVPVLIEGKVSYALGVTVPPEMFYATLRDQNLPTGWVATICDSQCTIVARSRDTDNWIGRKPAEAFLRQFSAESREGVFDVIMADGVPVRSHYTRSSVTNWWAAVNIPKETFKDQLLNRFSSIALAVAGLFAVAVGLAWFVGGKISRSFRALVPAALALGAGRTVPLPRGGVKEGAEVTSAMRQAAQLLSEQASTIRAREMELHEAHRLAKFGTWYWDLKTGAVSVSDSVREIYGRNLGSFSELRGTVLPVELWERIVEGTEEGQSAGRGDYLEHEVDHASGHRIWVAATCEAVRDGQGEVVAQRGTVQDITERKQMEIQLRGSHETFYNLIQNNPFGIYIVDADFRLSHVSLGAQKTFRTVSPLIGRDFDEVLRTLWPEPFVSEALGRFRHTLETGEPYLSPSTVERRVDIGEEESYDWRLERITMPDGRHGVVCYFYDLSDRQRWEAALRESEEKYRTLFSNMAEGFILGEPIFGGEGEVTDVRFLEVNEAFHQQTGIPRGIEGRPIGECLPQLEHFWIDRYIAVAIEGEAGRFEIHNADNGRHYDVYAFCPAPGRFAVLFRDVTERKQAEDALRQVQNMLAEGQKIAHLGSFEYVASTKTTVWSAEEYRIYGLDPAGPSPDYEDMLAGSIHPEDAAELNERFMKAMQNSSIYEFEHRIVRPDGSVRWVYDRAQPYFDQSGNLLRYVGATLDITDRKQAEEELRKLKDSLEIRVQERTADLIAANKQLEAFIFATSHDLKGPLGRINSFSALLEIRYRDRLDDEGLQFLNFVRQNSIRLTNLVEDLLSHARMSQGALELDSIEVKALAESIVQDRADELRQKNAKVSISLAPAQILGNATAISQAIGNLVENAAKYVAAGVAPIIEIGGALDGERYRLWVRDNGIGFDMAYHDKIFEIFGRLQNYSEYPGSGVGLALVKRAVERMGGRVWAESTPGQGATFYLEFQAAHQ